MIKAIIGGEVHYPVLRQTLSYRWILAYRDTWILLTDEEEAAIRAAVKAAKEGKARGE